MPTLEDLIIEVERAIPPDWDWLIRRNAEDDRYFGNIVPAKAGNLNARVLACPAYGNTPFEALKTSFDVYKIKFKEH